MAGFHTFVAVPAARMGRAVAAVLQEVWCCPRRTGDPIYEAVLEQASCPGFICLWELQVILLLFRSSAWCHRGQCSHPGGEARCSSRSALTRFSTGTYEGTAGAPEP